MTIQSIKKKAAWLGTIVVMNAHYALANTASLTQLETPIQKLSASITGPVMLGVGAIAFVIGLLQLLWNGELGDFGRKMSLFAIVIGGACGAVGLINTFGNNASALIF